MKVKYAKSEVLGNEGSERFIEMKATREDIGTKVPEEEGAEGEALKGGSWKWWP